MKKSHLLFLLYAGLLHLGVQQAQGIENDGAVDDFLDSILTSHQNSAPTAPPTRTQAASYDETAGMNESQVRELGVDYAEARHGKAKNEQKAIELYRKAADMGDMKAQRWMGWRYRQGRGVQQNEQLACTYFRMAALKCKQATSALYQKRLLTLLPMIRQGADVDITLPETKGNTALHYSCAIGSLSITRWLLEHGANPNAITNAGKTPMRCIGSDNRAAITKLLTSYGGQLYPQCH